MNHPELHILFAAHATLTSTAMSVSCSCVRVESAAKILARATNLAKLLACKNLRRCEAVSANEHCLIFFKADLARWSANNYNSTFHGSTHDAKFERVMSPESRQESHNR
ncbi:hypothetical protein MRX96_057639 [Rhipicephalus microplus]